jgi:hypothetical protein
MDMDENKGFGVWFLEKGDVVKVFVADGPIIFWEQSLAQGKLGASVMEVLSRPEAKQRWREAKKDGFSLLQSPLVSRSERRSFSTVGRGLGEVAEVAALEGRIMQNYHPEGYGTVFSTRDTGHPSVVEFRWSRSNSAD